MSEIDFITAFGRLLRDGRLREAFATDRHALATRINLSRNDWPAWLQLVPEDVEAQSQVLLRKRLDLVRHIIPETVHQLGKELWPYFLECAHSHWPNGRAAALEDAFRFCRWLRHRHEGLVNEPEWNRIKFALSKRHVAIFWHRPGVILHGKAGLAGRRERRRPLIQIFFRGRSHQWSEIAFAFGF